MNDILKWIGKFALQGILWTFVLSIRWNGNHTLFQSANETLVQNQLVATVDEELGTLWFKAKEAAKVTFSKGDSDNEKSL